MQKTFRRGVEERKGESNIKKGEGAKLQWEKSPRKQKKVVKILGRHKVQDRR